MFKRRAYIRIIKQRFIRVSVLSPTHIAGALREYKRATDFDFVTSPYIIAAMLAARIETPRNH